VYVSPRSFSLLDKLIIAPSFKVYP
jgi:hypothetical protein